MTQRRAQLRAFERMYSSTRVAQSLLRSPLTVTLADMIALVTDTDLVDVLVRLCKVLEQQPEAARPSPEVHLSALQTVAAELATHADHLDTVLAALAVHQGPEHATRTWAAVVTTPALWEQFPGPVVSWNVDFARIRRTKGYLSTDTNVPADPIGVVFDEGCEVCTITRAALQKHLAAWKKGHSPFFARDRVGPPRALCLQNVLHLHGFHGTAAGHSFMVMIHLR
jgi:hypothetical protein